MTKKVIENLDEMSLEELLDFRKQLDYVLRQKRCENKALIMLSDINMSKYRYKATMGTVNPQHMKQNVLKDNDKCMLGVSLGSPKSEEDRFEGTIRWISQHFKSCALVVGDSIYRYTLQVTDKMSPEDAKPAALQIGHDFVTKHEPIVSRYREACDFEWICMSQVEQHTNFTTYHELYQKLYEHDSVFHSQVNMGSEKYLGGLSNAQELLEPSTKIQNIAISANYFVEESAIFTCLCEDNWHVLIYPGTIKPLQILSEGKIANVPKSMLKLTQIRLNLKKKIPYISSTEQYDNSIRLKPAYGYHGIGRLKSQTWSQLMHYSRHKTFQAGDIISHMWDTKPDLGILYKGNVEILNSNLNTGKIQQVDTFGAVSFIGKLNFLSGSPFVETVVALTDGEILLLNERSFKKMRRTYQGATLDLLYHLTKVLHLRISHYES